MRPWVIVLSSALGALFVVAAIAFPEVTAAPHSEIASILLARLPALVVAALAVYGLCAILMTTATLVTDILQLRHHPVQTADQVSAGSQWAAAFVSGLRRLGPSLAAALGQSTNPNGSVAFGVRLTARETRGEIARLYYISLARSHFVSALIVLAGIAALGLAHDHASFLLQPGVIPTASAMMIIAGLMLLAILGRVAVDVTAEPLLETISQLPTELAEVRLLRRVVEILELDLNRPLPQETLPTSPTQIPQRLIASIEQGHHALLDAVSRLSASAGALESTMQTSLEMLETTLRMAPQQRPAEDSNLADAAGFPQLRAAVEELTAILQRLSAVPEGIEDTARADDRVPRSQTAAAPRVARELRQLLQEIEAAR